MSIKNKQGITPVIAVSLLLVVAVVAVVGFQNWYQSYSSTILTDVEAQSISNSVPDIETIIGDILYIKTKAFNLTISRILIDGIECLTNISLNESMNGINISSCLNNLSTSTPQITLISDDFITKESVYLKDIQVSIGGGASLPVLTSLSCTTDDDSDGQILWTCAIYPMTETIYEGDLDVNDLNDTIIDDKCWLKDYKSSCESNLIVDGCGTGTVQDLGTGLCWQRDMSSEGSMNWTSAKTSCDTLDLGGHTDWRLPKRQELFTIRDLSIWQPTIIGGNNNKFTNVIISGYYCSISTYGLDTDKMWGFTFLDGESAGISKTTNNNVFCVR